MLNFGYKINVRSIFILQQSTLTNQSGCELLRSKDRFLAVAISFHLCLYFPLFCLSSFSRFSHFSWNIAMNFTVISI